MIRTETNRRRAARPDWDLDRLEGHLRGLWPLGISVGELDPQSSSRE